MEKLKKGDVITLYSIVNETDSVKNSLEGKRKTYIGKPDGDLLARIFLTRLFGNPLFFIRDINIYGLSEVQELRPVARFTVRRLHNNDPETII